MTNKLYTKRVIYANCILLLFAISMNLTSCANDVKEVDSTQQNNFTKHNEFSNKLIQNPIFLEFLNKKLDFLLEYKFILDSKSAESASRIKNHFQSLQSATKNQSNAEIVAIPELSEKEAANLNRVLTNLYESAIQVKKLFNDNNFDSENEINKVFEIIKRSPQNISLLSDNLSKFYDSALEEKNPIAIAGRTRAETCNARMKTCLVINIGVETIIALGCGAALMGGPVAFIACLCTDVAFINTAGFELCNGRYRRCMRG